MLPLAESFRPQTDRVALPMYPKPSISTPVLHSQNHPSKSFFPHATPQVSRHEVTSHITSRPVAPGKATGKKLNLSSSKAIQGLQRSREVILPG